MSDIGRLFGRSMGFPPQVGGDGRISWSEGEQNIQESIRIILLTSPGERVMMPDFGAGLKRFWFQPNTVTTHRLIMEEITQSLNQWEPRIEVDSVDIEEDDKDPMAANVTIQYTLVANQVSDQLRFSIRLSG